jgi:hypothetical protein
MNNRKVIQQFKFPNQLFRSKINPIAAATKGQTPLPLTLSFSAALEVVDTEVGEVAVPLADVDVPEETDEALEGSIVVCEMNVGVDVTDVGTDTVVVGDDTDAGVVPVMVEIISLEVVERVRDGF